MKTNLYKNSLMHVLDEMLNFNYPFDITNIKIKW